MKIATPILRPIVWLGNSKRNIQGFPLGAQKLIGDELQLIQFGGRPKDAKAFRRVGSGVLEIASVVTGTLTARSWGVQLGRKIYVLHTF